MISNAIVPAKKNTGDSLLLITLRILPFDFQAGNFL